MFGFEARGTGCPGGMRRFRSFDPFDAHEPPHRSGAASGSPGVIPLERMDILKSERKFALIGLVVVFLPITGPVARATGSETGLDGTRLMEHVRFLSSDDLEGRATGQPGGEKAAEYVAGAFRGVGLDPVAGMDGYHQFYETSVAVSLGPDNSLTIPGAGGDTRDLVLNKDFVPFAFSASARVTGPVLFAGYGITAPEFGYDDYAGVDARGKIVLVLRHEPRENDESSVFDGSRHTRHAEFRVKARNALDHGALAILIVDDPLNHEPKDEQLVRFGSGAASEGTVSIPALHLRREFAEYLWGAGRPGRVMSMESVQRGIDDSMEPNSFVTSETPVTLETDIRIETRRTSNVLGWLPPTTGSGTEYIVIGAHYDHLGYGGHFSLAPDDREIHNGADDNASGTAGLIEIARALIQDPAPRRRGVLFVAFSGEEIGLRGSSWLVSHPPLPLDGAVAMLNMDMIGRLKDRKLTIGGVGTSPLFRPLLDRLASGRDLAAEYTESGYGPSDHNSFYSAGIPVLFFFTGAHEDYHRPSDDWQRINADGLVQVAGLALDVARELVMEAPPVPFAEAGEEETGGNYGGGSGGWLGIVPGYGSDSGGVAVTGVRRNGPAWKAGLAAGDVIVGFAGKDVAGIHDLQDGLDRTRPGDEVRVDVLRGKDRRSFPVTLGSRKQP